MTHAKLQRTHRELTQGLHSSRILHRVDWQLGTGIAGKLISAILNAQAVKMALIDITISKLQLELDKWRSF